MNTKKNDKKEANNKERGDKKNKRNIIIYIVINCNRNGSKEWKENNIIIGYDVKSETGIYIRFKIRSPIHTIKKFKDTRKIEKGSTCNSKSKNFLLDIELHHC